MLKIINQNSKPEEKSIAAKNKSLPVRTLGKSSLDKFKILYKIYRIEKEE